MTPEQRARLERELLREGAAVLSKDDLRAALAHIDALEARVGELEEEKDYCALMERHDALFVENERLRRRVRWAAENWPLELGRAGMHATQAEDRATLAEAERDRLTEQLEDALDGERRARNAEDEQYERAEQLAAERDALQKKVAHLEEAAGPIGCKPFTLGSACPCRLCVLERKADALTAERDMLREALSKVCIAAAYYGGDYVEREVDAVLNATLAPSKDDANATS